MHRSGINFYISHTSTVNLLITTFVITANVNFVCTKISGSCFFHLYSHFVLQENIRFEHLLELPRMIYEKKCSTMSVSDALD